jgi:hypothetical protein
MCFWTRESIKAANKPVESCVFLLINSILTFPYRQKNWALLFTGGLQKTEGLIVPSRNCIITDKEPVMTFAARGFVSKRGRKYQSLYKCRKPVKQYYIFTVVSDPDALNQTAKGIDGSGLQFEPGFILRTM